MDEIVSSPVSSPSKCTRKLPSLSQILGRKKRVGCLAVPKTGSVDAISQEYDFEGKKYESTRNVPDAANTNVSLCCAITEHSRTPIHLQLRFKSEKKSKMGKKKAEKSDRLEPSFETVESPPNGVVVAEAPPETKIEPVQTPMDLKKTKKSHSRSFSLSRGLFSTGEKEKKDVEKPIDSPDSTPAGRTPESSPSPVARPGSRSRFLMTRRSVDNIAASSSASSPLSVRSNPPNPDESPSSVGKKKKSRPASLVVISRKHQEKLADASRTASMDSLARQSLLAAQVLNILPASKARERNFLCGRIAANSLLGKVELERALPLREVSIYVATWNMNGQAPPSGLNPLLLPEGITHVPDIVVVGTQESYPEKGQWEVILQETLGPSHVMFQSVTFGTLHIAIFIRRDLIWFVSVADEATYSVRTGTAFRTKGAIAVAFYLFGSTFLFITCHLTAHQDKVKERLHDIRRIVKSLELPSRLPCSHKKNKDVTDNFDYVFWSGDLNFRLTRPRSEVLDWIETKTFPLTEPAQCTPGDQLTDSIRDGSCLRGFEEGPLTFAPSYKYDPGTSCYDTSSKQRTPSYTDRILYKSRRAGSDTRVDCIAYSSVPSVCTSDHKPVWGLYKCPIRPGIDTIPLNAGSFNREVYLEAIKRRAANMDQQDSTSAVCSLQ